VFVQSGYCELIGVTNYKGHGQQHGKKISVESFPRKDRLSSFNFKNVAQVKNGIMVLWATFCFPERGIDEASIHPHPLHTLQPLSAQS